MSLGNSFRIHVDHCIIPEAWNEGLKYSAKGPNLQHEAARYYSVDSTEHLCEIDLRCFLQAVDFSGVLFHGEELLGVVALCYQQTMWLDPVECRVNLEGIHTLFNNASACGYVMQ